jgi:hypothetical protein
MMNAEQCHLDEHLTLVNGVIDKCEHEARPFHDSIEG